MLDLGCRPGSWLQYALGVVGRHGARGGARPRRRCDQPVPGARVIVGDVYTMTDDELLGDLRAFDVVLSDMAPDTTGIRATDQARSADAGRGGAGAGPSGCWPPAGAFVAKMFQGPDVAALRKRMGTRFSEVHLVKPEASRAASTELYLVAKGFVPVGT